MQREAFVPGKFCRGADMKVAAGDTLGEQRQMGLFVS